MPESLNSSMEIHDSILMRVETSAKQLKHSFEGYIHKSQGRPGVDPGSGWIQNLILPIGNGTIEDAFQILPRDLVDGTLCIDEASMQNMIPIPLHASGRIMLKLMDKQSGENMTIRGDHISLELTGEAQYVEDFR